MNNVIPLRGADDRIWTFAQNWFISQFTERGVPPHDATAAVERWASDCRAFDAALGKIEIRGTFPRLPVDDAERECFQAFVDNVGRDIFAAVWKLYWETRLRSELNAVGFDFTRDEILMEQPKPE